MKHQLVNPTHLAQGAGAPENLGGHWPPICCQAQGGMRLTRDYVPARVLITYSAGYLKQILNSKLPPLITVDVCQILFRWPGAIFSENKN